MTYKALMLDVDGTTIPNKQDGRPSERVKKAIAEASKQISVSVATGRSAPMIFPLIDELQLNGPSIIHGGAQIIDAQTKKLLKEQSLDPHSLREVCALLNSFNVQYVIQDDKDEVTYSRLEEIDNPLGICAYSVEPSIAEEIMHEMADFSTYVVHKIPAWKKGTLALSITHSNATKQHAILDVANILEIQTHEIIGVGDGYNDFPLMMACGLKVAMGNAVEDLKAIADYVAPSVEEDGVAHVIEKFILNK